MKLLFDYSIKCINFKFFLVSNYNIISKYEICTTNKLNMFVVQLAKIGVW